MPLCRPATGPSHVSISSTETGHVPKSVSVVASTKASCPRKTFQPSSTRASSLRAFLSSLDDGGLNHDPDGMDLWLTFLTGVSPGGTYVLVLLGLGTLLLPAQILLYRAKYSGDMARLTLLTSARKATGHVLA